MGCRPASERSRIFRRRCPRPSHRCWSVTSAPQRNLPSTDQPTYPSPSGPRCASRSVARRNRRAVEGVSGASRLAHNATMPHTMVTLRGQGSRRAALPGTRLIQPSRLRGTSRSRARGQVVCPWQGSESSGGAAHLRDGGLSWRISVAHLIQRHGPSSDRPHSRSTRLTSRPGTTSTSVPRHAPRRPSCFG